MKKIILYKMLKRGDLYKSTRGTLIRKLKELGVLMYFLY